MRDIDEIIEYINQMDRLSAVHKRVLINRIEMFPTEQEIELGREQAYGAQVALRVG